MRPWRGSSEADVHARYFGGRHGQAASEDASHDQQQLELLVSAWEEGSGPSASAPKIPPRVALEIRDLLGLPKRLRPQGGALSLFQLGWAQDPEALWETIRLLPAFKPREQRTPTAQNLDPPGPDLQTQYRQALRDTFVGGQVSQHADRWIRMFPASPWAKKVAGVGWAFDRRLGQFHDPIFQQFVDLDNHPSCFE